MKKIVLPLICIIFLVVSISAFDFDNKLNEKTITFDGKSIENNPLLQKYNPIEIKNSFGLGKIIMQGYLSQHTSYCGIDCSSTIEINLLEDGVLIEDIMFRDLNGGTPTIDYQFYIIKNGNKIPYELGSEIEAGIYQILLEGKKGFTQTVDWIIKSNGEWIDEWAIWGGITYCYQETANVSTSCGGLSTGSYEVYGDAWIGGEGNLYDGNLATYANSQGGVGSIAYLNITYDKPNSYNNATWKVKDYDNTVNLTIPPNCWDYHSDKIVLMVRSTNSQSGNSFKNVIWSCYDGTWNQLRLVGETSGIPGGGNNIVYEEAIFWEGNSTVTLESPIDSFINSSSQVEFNCSAFVLGGSTLVNISLWTNQSGTFQQEDVTTGLSGSIETTTWNHDLSTDGFYLWTCQACDSDNDCGFASENRTLEIDITFPQINITYPITISNFAFIGENETLNWTISDVNLDMCWYDYNNINTTVTCNDNTTNFILVEDWYNITLWTNDTVGNTNSSFFEWEYQILVNSQTYTSSTYDTMSETFTINITANSSLTAANLIHNGISHGGTKSGTVYSTTFDIPLSLGDKTFYWDFTYAGSSILSYNNTQYVNNTLLGICDASQNLTVPYINFTFVDEETLDYINATIDTSTWAYYLGSGTITKELLFSNNTVNDNYAFCLSASNHTLHNTRSVQYASPGYPQRKYDASSDLTNSTTNKILYLLSSVDGIYTTIQIIDEQGDKVGGVEVTAERQFSGVWTVIGQEITDDAGAVTFWVNPDYDHRFTFISDDCVDTTTTIRPTQTQYTQQLQCGVGYEVYVTQIEGIKYSRTPQEGLILTGEHNFTFEVVSSKDNIVNISMEIVNASDGTILVSNWSSCNPQGCTIYALYTVLSGADLKGRYYIDIGNGTFLIEGDAHWINVLGPTAFDGKSGFRTFWLDMIYVFQEWGDDSNTADFNRLVAIFFLMCVSISVLNYHFNLDTMNPGAFMFILTIIVLMGSMVGGLDSQGFFYFNNLASADKLGEQGANFVNNYILVFFCMIISVSYWVNVNRQAQR